MVVGFVLAFLTSHNVHASAEFEQNLTGLLTVILGGAYYVVAHLLQSRWPLAGLLLGSTARPTYTGRHRKASAIDPATATSDIAPEDRP
jgi:xanthosine utilization system XapX-like protein